MFRLFRNFSLVNIRLHKRITLNSTCHKIFDKNPPFKRSICNVGKLHIPKEINTSHRNYFTWGANGHFEDTIYALSSGMGKAGVAVIRVSGPGASKCINKLTKSFNPLKDITTALPPSRKAVFRKIVHPTTGETLDHGIIVWFPGPNSFTGEDIVEFQVHGGNAVVKGILSALGQLEDYRPAERGEFARRAFENDKLDLTEVEGLADLLNAETEVQRRLALRQAGGALKGLYENWRSGMIKNLALVEAIIDFGEDENIEDGIYNQVHDAISSMYLSITEHMNDNRRGEILREGIHIAILGLPNAGKSSFLNRIAQRDVAIVSHIPGTTRDVVETTLNIGGYPVVLGDTAGLRDTDNLIEAEGVSRAKKRIQQADIKICIVDVAALVKHEAIFDLDKLLGPIVINEVDKNTILLLNKSDEVENSAAIQQLREIITKRLGSSFIWDISCKTGKGIDGFLKGFTEILESSYGTMVAESPLITQARHRVHLEDCIDALERFLGQEDIVLGAEDLRHATNAMGRITGRIDVEEVLDVIFQEFCIGK
ncbi:mitochondrial splicing system protein [Basidiobolus ranarum]|uniref:Mitochondrial splicing system protein n=1 Tax=Basidiobolus ranarum TaxID=34480 RepID=A0ABR2WMU7_9FUNG